MPMGARNIARRTVWPCRNVSIRMFFAIGRACNPELKAFDVIEEIIENVPEDVKNFQKKIQNYQQIVK